MAFTAPPAADPPVTEIAARLRAAVAAHKDRHQALAEALKITLRPGELTRWTSLRRMLRLAGHRDAPSHAITLALLEVMPNARHGRAPPRGRGPRCIFGVRLVVALHSLRAALEARWEDKLTAEGMPAELQQISARYKLPLLDDFVTPGTALYDQVLRVHLRKHDASRYYGIACEYLHTTQWDKPGWRAPGQKQVWALHCEGATRDEIAEETGKNPNEVQSILDFHRARAGLTFVKGNKR